MVPGRSLQGAVEYLRFVPRILYNLICALTNDVQPPEKTGGRIAFHMTVDPLKTYAGELMATSFMIARSETKGSPYFIDAEKALQGNKVVDYDILGHIPQDTTGNKYVLTVAGGF